MSNTSTGREIEDLEARLLADKSFQHILKFAPQSQRGLMTFELAKYFSALYASHTNAARIEMLDRIEESVKQHTVPEGKHLVTRSYVLNTLEFERNRIQKESAEQSIKNSMGEKDKRINYPGCTCPSGFPQAKSYSCPWHANSTKHPSNNR